MVSASRNVINTESVAAWPICSVLYVSLVSSTLLELRSKYPTGRLHDALEDLTAQAFDDVPTDVAHAVGLREITQTA